MNDSQTNFETLVLLCINADFCDPVLSLQHSSISTKWTHLCTAPNSKNKFEIVNFFENDYKYWIIHVSAFFLIDVRHFEAEFWWNFIGTSRELRQFFSENYIICPESDKFNENTRFSGKLQQIFEISEIAHYSLFTNLFIHLLSSDRPRHRQHELRWLVAQGRSR